MKSKKVKVVDNYCISLARGFVEQEFLSKQWHFVFFSTNRRE